MLKKKNIIFILIIFVVLFSLFYIKNKNNVKEESVVKESGENYDFKKYYGYLIIPKINMKLGFYYYDSLLNDVAKNIELIKIPVENSYLIAGHSGTGKIAFFNDLKDLIIGDDIYIRFQKKENHYVVSDIKRVIKSGKINISDEENKIYLTTCDQIIDGYQLIIEGNLT